MIVVFSFLQRLYGICASGECRLRASDDVRGVADVELLDGLR